MLNAATGNKADSTCQDDHGFEVPEQKLNKYHLVLFQQPQAAESSIIDRELVERVQQELDRVVTTPPDQTEIDVWVDSFGGDAHAAYKLVLELRSRCAVLRGVVPDRAKSAATLMILGMDKIYMAASAELGPLDAQIEHPGRDNMRISALDVADSLAFMGQTAFEIMFAGGALIVFQLGLPRIDVLNSSLQFASQLVAPAVAKLDPHLIHQAKNLLRVTEQYAVSLLTERRGQSQEATNLNAMSEMVRKLVKEYPAHGYVISRGEARDLGLEIEDAELHPRWQQIKNLHRISRQRETSFIQILSDLILETSSKQTNKKEKESESETAADPYDNAAVASANSEATANHPAESRLG